MQALKVMDRDAFTQAEGEGRQAMGLPPYGRLAALIVSSPDPEALDRFALELARRIPTADRVEVYGPADAPLALVRGRRRKRFLVRADRDVDIQAYLRAWLSELKVPGSVRLNVDVDPYSFL
jgi:primosomal protein N' (replication factor Y)